MKDPIRPNRDDFVRIFVVYAIVLACVVIGTVVLVAIEVIGR